MTGNHPITWNLWTCYLTCKKRNFLSYLPWNVENQMQGQEEGLQGQSLAPGWQDPTPTTTRKWIQPTAWMNKQRDSSHNISSKKCSPPNTLLFAPNLHKYEISGYYFKPLNLQKINWWPYEKTPTASGKFLQQQQRSNTLSEQQHLVKRKGGVETSPKEKISQTHAIKTI